jgi:DNA mismatch repair protein MutS
MFYRERILTSEIQEILDRIVDIERVVGRIGVGSANPKDMVAFAVSLENILSLIEKLGVGQLPSRLRFLVENVRELENEIRNVSKLILNSLDDEPSAVLNQGGIIRTGYNSEVDELKSLRQNSKQILAEIQRREIERTKITSLKISFNNVFGYYIEVTRTHLDKVPTDYIRKQTLANAERFITEELKELETRILSAEEKLIKLEQELFIEIRNQVAEYSAQLLEIGDVVAEIDVLSNFGEIARENRYVKPVISSQLSVISRESEDSTLKTENLSLIAAGRHPVVETLVKEFTPNSTIFDDKGRIHIITGPNMSGKSTYIRQVALIQLMAQIGCFVPADEAEICIADRIFTRVGASDNLSKGESTFMVEMNETANILNNATKDSLIILDEVGRGTSTYDGVAIAWSIVEYISQKIGARTLFATHYHELTELSQSYKGVKNYTVNVIEENENVLFTHRIVEGSADKSYGVYVAKLAGVPIDVVKRANEILDRFEKREAGDGIENENERRDMGNGNEPGIEKRDLRNVTLEDKNRPESRNSHPVSPKVPKKIHPEQLGLI